MADSIFPTLVSKDANPNATSDPIYVQLTDGTSVLTTTSGALSVNVSNASLTVTQATGSNLHVVVDAGSAVIGHVITDSGSTTAVTGNVTVVQPTGTNLHVVVDSGSVTIGELTQGSTTSGQTGILTMGAATTAAPTYTTATTNPLSLTTAGALRTDSSATTQPISAASLPLPTGAATSALQTSGNSSLTTIATNTTPLAQGSTTSGQSGSLSMGAVTTAAPTYTTGQTDPLSLTTAGALRVDASATTQPVSIAGTVSENIAQYGGVSTSLGQKVMASSIPVTIASDQSAITVSSGVGAQTGAVCDYATATVAANSTSNHNYTVVTNMKISSVSFACSGGGKAELKVGPLATLVSKWVGFVPTQGGEVKMVFNPPIVVPTTSTGTVQIVMTNRQNQAQDLYSTIVGVDA